jgi:hypothetical protein
MRPITRNTMRAVAIDRFGGLETMTLQTLPIPTVGPDEILIHVESAGVGAWDPFEREGGFARLFGIEPPTPTVPSTPITLASSPCGRCDSRGEIIHSHRPSHYRKATICKRSPHVYGSITKPKKQ